MKPKSKNSKRARTSRKIKDTAAATSSTPSETQITPAMRFCDLRLILADFSCEYNRQPQFTAVPVVDVWSRIIIGYKRDLVTPCFGKALAHHPI